MIWPTALGLLLGGPDYALIAAQAPPTAIEPPPVVEHPTVTIDGEQVPFALDLWDWEQLAACESGGRWHIRSRAYSGGVQFVDSTWRAVGGTGRAADAPIAEQIERARILLDRAGWGSWPGCSRKLGYR